MRSQRLFPTVLFAAALLASMAAAATAGDHCSNDFVRVAWCQSYVTGNGTKRSKNCCDFVVEIEVEDPVCLCYAVLYHPAMEPFDKSGDVDVESRFIPLPTACKLINANISDCPKLLKKPTNSPGYASWSWSPTVTISAGSNHGPQAAPLVAIAMAFFFLCGFPVEVVSTFST